MIGLLMSFRIYGVVFSPTLTVIGLFRIDRLGIPPDADVIGLLLSPSGWRFRYQSERGR